MKRDDEKASVAQLTALLGPVAFIRLVEAYGGTRLFIPTDGDDKELIVEIGEDAWMKLADRWGGFHIRVPLAKEFRARHYRAAGLSNAKIARKLGMTEPGVNQLFGRMKSVPVKGSGDPLQLKLFG